MARHPKVIEKAGNSTACRVANLAVLVNVVNLAEL
jgi:hypothetical protein